jgi:hypothetical protein
VEAAYLSTILLTAARIRLDEIFEIRQKLMTRYVGKLFFADEPGEHGKIAAQLTRLMIQRGLIDRHWSLDWIAEADMDWIIVLAVLILSGFLYYDASKRVPVTKGAPLAPAVPISGLELGSGLNLAGSASDFSGDRWKPERLTVKQNAAVAPDGTQSATRLGEIFAAGLHRIETVVSGTIPGEPSTLSLFVKPDNRAGIQFEMADNGVGKYGVARFDFLQKGVVAQIGDVVDSGLQALPDGWFRCWAVMPYALDRAVFNFTLLNTKGEWRYLGNGFSGLFIWGVQFEHGRQMSGYSSKDSDE